VSHWFYHWAVQDFYNPVWPNIVASLIATGAIWAKLHAIHKLHRKHFELTKAQAKQEGDQNA
jgi:hypothetical protein